MWTQVAVIVVLVAGVYSAPVAHTRAYRDDAFVLANARAEFVNASHDTWRQVLTVCRDAARHSVPLDMVAFEDLVAPDAEYAFHGRGRCHGRQQLVECVLAEQQERELVRRRGRGVEYQISRVREGAVEVVRTMEVHRAGNEELRRWLDVYFVHADRLGRVAFVEHMPTVDDPLRSMPSAN